MYAVAISRHRKPVEEVLRFVDDHRAYLRDLKAAGTVLAPGPLEPRHGGALLLRLPDGASTRRCPRSATATRS